MNPSKLLVAFLLSAGLSSITRTALKQDAVVRASSTNAPEPSGSKLEAAVVETKRPAEKPAPDLLHTPAVTVKMSDAEIAQWARETPAACFRWLMQRGLPPSAEILIGVGNAKVGLLKKLRNPPDRWTRSLGNKSIGLRQARGS